jgi:thioredoxin 1
MLKHYSGNNFDELKKSKVLVDFYAEWCGPCKMLSSVLEELAKESDINIVKIDVDKYQDLAREYGVMSIPCLILFDNEKEIKRTLGFMPKEKLKEFINN